MEVRLLGPLAVVADGVPVEIAAPKERAILEVLGLRAGEIVSAESLVDALWGDDPPPSASKSLQSHLSRLRRALPDGVIVTAGVGYRLLVDPDDVDAFRLGQLASTDIASFDR